MNTSELRSDFLIIGFQALAWITLLFLTCFGYSWINLNALKDWIPLLIVFLLGLSYPLGIIQNALLGSTLNYQKIKRPKSRHEETRLTPFDKLIYISTRKPELAANLHQNILRTRLIRATAINLVLMAILGLLFYSIRIGFTWRGFLFGSILAFFTLITSHRALVSTTLENLTQINRVYSLIKQTKTSSRPT